MFMGGCVLCSAVASPVRAQRTWPERGAAPLVGIEVGKAMYRPLATPEGVLRFSAPTSTLTASVWLPIGKRFTLTSELPVSHAVQMIGATQSAATVLGDPWIGLETALSRDLIWEIGVRPGIVERSERAADTLARTNGVAADYDHYEAWRAGTRSLRSTVHFDREFVGGLFVGALAGGSVAWRTTGQRPHEYNENEQFAWFIPVEDPVEPPFDVYLLYAARVGYRGARVATSLAFIGRGYPTRHGPSTEPTVHQLGVDVRASSGRVRPHAELRVYRDLLLQPRTAAVATFGVKVWR